MGQNVFVWDGALPGGGLVAVFRGAFASAGGVFVLPEGGGGWALGYHSVGFGHFPNIS